MAAAQDREVAQVDYKMARLPYKTGYSPLRWRVGYDYMLLKKQGVYEVSKLCAILLFEADFNQNNKRLSRTMMYQAEDLQLLANEQFGSRKQHSAIDHCLNKVLMFDLSRLTCSH